MMLALRFGLAVALVGLLAAPPVAGHASPEPLDNEVHLIGDEASDLFGIRDGFDIQDLFVREAYHRATDENGAILRVILYGGPVPGGSIQRIEIDAGATTITLTTTDGLEWATDATLIHATMEPSDDGLPAVQGSLQVFVPHQALGTGLGGSLAGFAVRAYTPEGLVDEAPGGYYVGGAPVPDPNAGSTVHNEAINLDGPTDYTTSTLTRAGNEVTIHVENLITVVGQHVTLDARGAIESIDTEAKSVDPGQHPSFTFRVDDADAPWTFHIISDLGGRETLTLAADQSPGGPGGEGDPDTGGGSGDPENSSDEESPGLAVAAALAALVALVSQRRRRESQ